jgi:hypothetical protein
MKITIQELLRNYADEQINLVGINLSVEGSREKLKGADLRSINFFGLTTAENK